MQLRAHWDHPDHKSNDMRALLSVDVRVPKYPAFCNCQACTAIRVLASSGVTFAGTDAQSLPNHNAKELTGADRDLVDGLLGIHGVINIQMDDYSVLVTRGLVFEWSEIKPRVEAVVAEWAGAEVVRERVGLWRRVREWFGKWALAVRLARRTW